ncbi:MAG: hypothetical protein JNM98_07285 [Rhodocyclaceae bacterium]|nr:hypothetical protein [Rhodocyclaceae bacterium]
MDWKRIVREQQCPFLSKTCYKVRKSEPGTSIGSCAVLYGKENSPVVICPTRFLERRQIFTDCLHLLTTHQPGSELHIVQEVSIPGGSVDYFLTSVRNGKVKDFVGIEIQTLDTTGTVWPERQRLLKQLGVPRHDNDELSEKSYGMNWKMTAKTILVQMLHKIQTFEHVNKKLVLVVQDGLFRYMAKEFTFDHLTSPAAVGDAMHMHVYRLEKQSDHSFSLGMLSRVSTDSTGIAKCMGLQAEARVELAQIVTALEQRLSPNTRFNPV